MKSSDAVRICKNINRPFVLKTEKMDAIKKVVECFTFNDLSRRELWQMIEFLLNEIENDERAKK